MVIMSRPSIGCGGSPPHLLDLQQRLLPPLLDEVLKIGKASVKWKILGALLLTAAICSHHFIAMGAAKIILDPVYVMPNKRRSSRLAATSAYIQRRPFFGASRTLDPGLT
jgi:hypothetical protein